ncbi:MAG TPA: DUF2924 domain-containing protein [Kiloniellaceae bacterium]|nr:DUF2924 domain-containing protein [Kiloniellaceae bacterium]
MTPQKTDGVDEKIAALVRLDRSALLKLWIAAYGAKAPPHLSQSLMVRAMAHEIQVRAYGGLSTRTKRALKAALTADGKVASPPCNGSRLVREWHGRLHEVEVLAEGYLYRGKRYRSLSAIAKVITGTKWSGPRFFQAKAGS